MAGKEKPKAPPKPPAKLEKTTEGERIAKVLSRAGIASRREAERLIELGEVKVNGAVITSPALNVTAKDKITVRGEPVGAPEPPRLWLYYKPEGLVTSASDEKGRDTVFDHLPEDMPRVMSVGRLDLNSEGLLLLTNDGELKRRLELPSTGWLRKYRVRVKGNPTEPEIEPLRKGVIIEGERFQPMEVKLDRHQGANAWLTVGIREGKNREIRRAMSHIGLTVNRLIRTSYGPFRLNELQPGEVEEVRPKVLREQLGLSEGDVPSAPRTGRKPDPKPAANPGARAGEKPRASAAQDRSAKAQGSKLKPGDGLKQLSETWQKATRGPSRKTEGHGTDGPDAGRPARSARPARAPARPGAPRKG
ncbi:MAG: rRNA pseudouridine synthase [Tabrizicola sp.]|nr:rRNA pseudouridine synthase [Tabrizicola sp.]